MKNSDTFILTDVLPSELPLIYSNVELFEYIGTSELWRNIVLEYDNQESVIPVKFYTKKNNGGKRTISLPHPLSQLAYTKFIERFEQEILHFFQINGSFSIRYPSKVYDQKAELGKEDFYSELQSYFEYPTPIITSFYNSKRLLDLELKFKTLQKIDLQNCFDSIYSHSIEWAYIGSRETVKKRFRNADKKWKQSLGFILDIVARLSNDGETNGILIGPEFSRIVAEIILSRIDDKVEKKLEIDGLIKGLDYDVVRYIDDIFIFSNNEITAEKIVESFESYLDTYKLKINNGKSFFESRPFLKDHTWVPKIISLNNQINEFLNIEGAVKKSRFRKNSFLAINRFISTLKGLINEYGNQKHHLISYSITTVESNIIKAINTLKKSDSVGEIKNSELSNKIAKEIRIELLLDYLLVCLVFSPVSKSAIRYCKVCFKLVNHDKRFEEIIFKRTLNLFENSEYVQTELINIIVLMKFFDRDIPQDVLLKILGENINYLNLIVVAFYLDSKGRRNRYKKVWRKLNIYLASLVEDLKNKSTILNTGLLDIKSLKMILKSNEFLILNDFRSYPSLNKRLTDSIADFFDLVMLSSVNEGNHEKLKQLPFLELYRNYIFSNRKGFINWKYNKEDVQSEIRKSLSKNMVESSYF